MMPAEKVIDIVARAAGVPAEAVGEPIPVVSQGDCTWYVVPLPNGRWAATDDAEVDPSRVTITASYEDAVLEQRLGYLNAVEFFGENGIRWLL